MPTTYFSALLLLSIGLHYIIPIRRIVPSPHNYAGFILVGFGILMNLWTDSLFKIKKTTVKPHQKLTYLITYGPFRISRHPMYLGMASILLGVAVILRSLIAFTSPIIFVAVTERSFIPMEEENLQQEFGERYLTYKNQVRRWV